METKININCTIHLSDDKIKEGDLFFFYQHSGTPTIRKAKSTKDGEDWNGFVNSATRENSYRKIEKIEGLLLSPKN